MNPSVHHVARRDDVRSRLDVRDRRAREELEALVVRHLAVDEHAAMAVRGVLAETDVGHEHELREAGPKRAERLLDDAVVLPRPGRLLVLVGRDAEEDDRLHARADELLDLADGAADRVARHAGQLLVRQRLRRDEERHHELVEAQVRLADEAAEAAAAAEPPQPDVGEAGHRPKEYVARCGPVTPPAAAC